MLVLFVSTVELSPDGSGIWKMRCPVRLDEVGWHPENQGWGYRGSECHGPYPSVLSRNDGIQMDYRA